MITEWTAEIRVENRGKRGGKYFRNTNARETHLARARRVSTERAIVRRAWEATNPRPPAFPIAVTFVRHSAGTMDDDNVRSAYKGARDEIAKLLGLKNDAGAEVSWRYEQEKAPRGTSYTIIRMVCRSERRIGAGGLGVQGGEAVSQGGLASPDSEQEESKC